MRLVNIHLFLALLFSRGGARAVYFIKDDGIFPHTDTIMRAQNKKMHLVDSVDMWISNFIFGMELFIIKKLFKKDIKLINVSDFVSSVKINEVERKSCELEKTALSSCRRYFQKTDLDFSGNGEHLEYYQQSGKCAEIALKIGKHIIHSLKPDYFFTIDGVYASTEPVYKYVRKHQDNAFVLEDVGYVSGYSTLINNVPAMFVEEDNVLWEGLRRRGLSADELKKMEDYFHDRIYRKKYENSQYFPREETVEIVIEKSKKVFCAFPNVIWDANLVERDVIFKDNVEWLVETARYFIDHPDLGHLIIRFHPSETTLLQGCLKFEEILKQGLGYGIESAKNITLIHSDVYVNSYQLMEKYADICIVYDSITALESVYLKKPVIICGKGRYRNKGFSFDPANRDEYFRLLSEPDKLMADFNASYERWLKDAYTCAFFYLFYSAIPLPTLIRGSGGMVASNILRLSSADIESVEKDLLEHLNKLKA